MGTCAWGQRKDRDRGRQWLDWLWHGLFLSNFWQPMLWSERRPLRPLIHSSVPLVSYTPNFCNNNLTVVWWSREEYFLPGFKPDEGWKILSSILNTQPMLEIFWLQAKNIWICSWDGSRTMNSRAWGCNPTYYISGGYKTLTVRAITTVSSFLTSFAELSTMGHHWEKVSASQIHALIQPGSFCGPKSSTCHHQDNLSLNPSLWVENFLLSLQLAVSSPTLKSIQLLTSLLFWKTEITLEPVLPS